jgi:hypothetical protein
MDDYFLRLFIETIGTGRVQEIMDKYSPIFGAFSSAVWGNFRWNPSKKLKKKARYERNLRMMKGKHTQRARKAR